MISADVKSNTKQQEIKDLVVASYKFLLKVYIYLQNFKYSMKKVFIFQLILVGIPSILILPVKNRGMGEGGGVINGQNLLTEESYLSTAPYHT